MPDLTFTYSNRPFSAIITIVIGLALAAVFAWFAIAEDNPEFDLFGGTLTGWQATTLIWLIVALMLVIAGLGLRILIGFRRNVREVSLGPTALRAPKVPLSRRMVTVPYEQITDIARQRIFRDTILVISHTGGEIRIPRLYLPSADAFTQIESELMTRWAAARRT
ncbi:hypothetical protein [Cognatiyoonia koreensis]|uniref:hypothetical protein n=1 Tax=Cognatiyoonia koreensis TaxID=364200 RepID=UPI001042536E|nr:hypothetical protein [Cognatiyoonia koreensis]